MHKLLKYYLTSIFLFLLPFSEIKAACLNVTADFTITQSHVCGIPRGITLTNTSSGVDNTISKYYWYINGSLFDSSVNLIIKYTTFYAPGTYSISLVAKSPNDSCRDSTTKSVTVTSNKPRIYDANYILTYSPQFYNCITQLASNLHYDLQLSVEDSLFSYKVLWGDGTDTSGAVFSPNVFFYHTYTTLGTFSLKIISTSGGCTDTITGIVNNERIPSSGIIGPPVGTNSGCIPYAVRFINNSYNTSGTTRFVWDWGDGMIDTLGAATFNDTIYHLYKSGAFIGSCIKTVTLTAINLCGSSTSSWSSVYLYDKDKAHITVVDSIKCLPKSGSTFSFQNTSSLNCVPGVRQYFWDFGDGSTVGWIQQKTTQTHTYAAAGKYRVMLIDSNLCHADTFKLDVYVTLNPTSGITFTNRIGCKPFAVTFTDTVTTNLLLRTRQWDLADTSNGQPRYDTSKSVSHTFNNAGIYIVRCLITNPCDTISSWVVIEVYETPHAQVTPFGNGCEPHVLNGFNQSSKVSPYVHYSWDFGDGTYSTVANPPIKSYSSGSYTVKLKITDTCGSDSNQISFIVYSKVRADYFTDTVCSGDITHFNADSSLFLGASTNDSIVSFTYKDSLTNIVLGVSSNKRFTYTFTTSGLKKITLTASTLGGCSYEVTKTVLVKEHPAVSFTYIPFPNICNGSSISFTGNAAVTLSTITGYSWDFGDGSFAGSKDTVHTFASPGTYAVKLTVYNNFACPSTFTDSIKVRFNPKAKIKLSANCLGQVTSLLDSSYVLGGDVVNQWAWDYTGDGTFDAFTKNTTYSYGAAGIYTTILRVTTNRGCVAFDTAHFIIDTLPGPAFSVDASNKCMFQPFVFTNTSTRAAICIWKWGDGTTNTTVAGNATQQHAYTSSGAYTVKLYAYAASGCMDSTIVGITVNPKSAALFTVNDTAVCAPFNFHFVNQSLNSNLYQWYVNGSLVSTNTVLPDTFVSAPNSLFQIRLIAGNTNLCLSDTYNLTVRTFVDPVANFTAYSFDSCNSFTVHFVNLSTGTQYYKWNFNDNSAIDTNSNPVHTFINNSNKDSVYNVKLISYNAKGCNDTMTLPVHVRPKPSANFSLSNTDSCGPFRVNFTNLSSPGDTETIYTMHFLWNFGNGITSNARDTSVQFTAAANNDTTYRIKLFAYSKHNCVDTISKTLVVHPNAKANFTMTRSDSCGPLRVEFTNTSTPGNNLGINVMSFKWNFGNGITSSAKDTAVTFVASATNDTVYNVRLVSISNFGCHDTIIKQVTVYAKPKAQFTRPDSAGCGPASVTFTNTSFPNGAGNINGMSFFWNFGNGLTSTQRDPTTTFVAAKLNDTVYYITLIAYSSHGCPDTARSTYRVYPNPKDTFTSASSGCSPFTVSFTNLTNNAYQSYWSFGDGGTDTVINPTHVYYGRYLLDTSYLVKMVSKSIYGCPGDTVTKIITVKAKPLADFSASAFTGCSQASVQFLNNSQGAMSSNWNFADGTSSASINPSHYFANNTNFDTTYNVRLIVTSPLGCADTIIKPVTIYARPAANFTMSSSGACGPLSVTFINTSSNGNGLPISTMTFKWDFGNGVTSTSPDNMVTFAAGNTNDTVYNVKLISYSNHGCTDTITKTVTVHPRAKANFTNLADGCGPVKVTFTNTSSNGNGQPQSVMSFKWDFGNGITSTAKDTSVTFASSATKDSVYNVMLIAYSNYGCSDTMIRQIRVYPKPTSLFTMSDSVICTTGAITFTNKSYPNDTGSINIMSFRWDFGNGKTSINRDETVNFGSSRIQDTVYTITLIAFSEHGCPDTSIQYVKVYPKPIDSFSVVPVSGCYNFPVVFSNQTINGDKYYWDFGDGSTDTAKNVTHYYINTTFGSLYFFPKLVSTSIHGCLGDTVSRTVEVKPRPFADFATAPDSGCSPLRVQFLNMSIGATAYTWYFGDGTTSNQINPVHYFYLDTTYTITLVSLSQWGCPDTTRKTIKVKTLPNGALNVSNSAGCSPLNVQFTNTSTGAVRYEWYFGDGFMDTATNPSHTYTNNLNYTIVNNVMMLSYNSFGCADTTRYPITVYPKPKANFIFSQPVACGNSRFKFNDYSVNCYSFLWKFGDGITDTAKNPTHDFMPAQYTDTFYTVTLIVTSIYGCKDTVTKTVLVPVLVHASISANPISGCSPLTVNFMDLSKNATSLIWYFGDGLASSIKNPSHTYSTPGKYAVTLVAIGANGCMDTSKYIDLVNVIEVPKASFSADPMIQALPATHVKFSNTSIFSTSQTSFTWKFGDGTTSTLKNDEHSFTDTGTYKVTLIVSNGFCSDSVVRYIKITPYLPVASYTIDNASGCLPVMVNFTNKSTNATDYFWEFGDGNTSQQSNPSHVYQNAGIYTVRLKAFGISGVDDTIMYNSIVVFDRPVANFAGGPLISYLPKGDVNLINLSTRATSYLWVITNTNDGSVMMDSAVNPKLLFTKEGVYTVKLIAYNEHGCTDSITIVNYLTAIGGGEVFVPNAFSPDNNNVNDVFKPEGYAIITKSYKLSIYDRWGELLFISTDPEIGWDGTFKDRACMMDTYVWILEGKFINEQYFRKKGTVMLVR